MSPKASTRLLATQSDERLAAMARAGHDRAFEALVQRYRRPLLRYCRRIAVSDSRAEDVVQQSLLQAWSALRRGAQVRELRPWLYRIAHNTSVNLARDAARDGSNLALDLDDAAFAEPAAVESDLAGGLALRDALTDMAALPHMQREVIFRTALAGHSHEEVASALGISDGAVRGLLYRARATLRTAITALTPPPLLSWMADSGQGAGAERVGELAAGGGLGLGGLLVKGSLAAGGLAALTAGSLITGAAVVHSGSSAHRHAHLSTAGAAGHETAGLGTPGGASAPSGGSPANAGAGPSSAPSIGRHAAHKDRAVRLKVISEAPSTLQHAPIASLRHPAAAAPDSTAPTSYTVHVPAASAEPPPSSSTPSPGAPSGGSAGGSAGGEAGGSSGGGSSGGGSQELASGGGGESGTGSAGGGGAGGEGSGGTAEGSSPPSSGGSASQATGPVGTVVHEVTGLLEHTVHGVLGHSERVITPASTSALRAVSIAAGQDLSNLARHAARAGGQDPSISALTLGPKAGSPEPKAATPGPAPGSPAAPLKRFVRR